MTQFTFDRSFLQSTIEATRNYNCHLNDLHDLLIVRTFWFREQGKRGATGTPLEKKLYQDLSEGAKVLQAKASVWVGYSEQMCDEAYAKEEHEDGQLPGPMRMMLDMMAGIGIDVSQE